MFSATVHAKHYQGRFFFMKEYERWNTDRFLREVKLLPDKDDYIFSDYEDISGSRSKFTVQCKECSHVWETEINRFFSHGSRCFVCARGGPRWSVEKFLREIDLLKDKEDYIFSDYENINRNKSKFTVYCKKCNNVWSVDIDHFFGRNSRCINCFKKRWTNNRVIEEFNLTADSDKFEVILTEEIICDQSRFAVKCKKGHIWVTTPQRYFISKSRCPICNESKGEKKIASFLEQAGIIFEREKRFSDCRCVYPLPYDFYLPNFNLLIEMQGEQHYKISRWSRNLEKNLKQFEQIQKRDSIKKQFAVDNGYRFLEISYEEINQIEEILTRELIQ